MPKSRKFRKDYKIEFELDPMRDVPFTKLEKVLPKPKTMVYYYQKNHGKNREPSIVIFNQKIQGRSKKMGGMRRSISEKYNKTMKRRVKKTRRNIHKKYKKAMMGGVNTPPSTRPSTPPLRFNLFDFLIHKHLPDNNLFQKKRLKQRMKIKKRVLIYFHKLLKTQSFPNLLNSNIRNHHQGLVAE